MTPRLIAALLLSLSTGAGCKAKATEPAATPTAGSASGATATSPTGRVLVCVTVDWEGAYISPEGLDALDEVRKLLGNAPVTHFMSAGYFTKPAIDKSAVKSILDEVKPGDELAMHVHGWRSLAKASGIEPKLTPSFLTGPGKLLEFEDGDVGFDLDLDAYSVPELRAILRTSKKLLADATHLPMSTSFRAGGYLGTPKVLQAIHEEGFTVDSSATDYRQLADERKDEILPNRLHALWPTVDTASQPFLAGPDKSVLEVPIAAFADYATTEEIVAILEAAHARLAKDPAHDTIVVIGFHQETGADFAARVRDAFQQVRARKELADEQTFVTVADAAARARATAR